jgi:hypothetical protein
MRRSLTACRSGLSVAAAVVLLTACGGSGEEESASSESSGSSSSAAETSAGAADSEFCTEAAGIEERITSSLGGQTDPAGIPQALQQAATEIRAIEAPDEIASDWNALADGVDQIAGAFASIDFNDPQALATLQQEVEQLSAQLDTASTNVEAYLAEECGIEVDPTQPAAPTS